uniref:Uncharacterized protein n=1 Tax=Molossus molossus TaxID=27622 RepID=A0A7J8JW45_MOLMO|nr:hypothetical protein HJG59_008067 [Molossus molossus]
MLLYQFLAQIVPDLLLGVLSGPFCVPCPPAPSLWVGWFCWLCLQAPLLPGTEVLQVLAAGPEPGGDQPCPGALAPPASETSSRTRSAARRSGRSRCTLSHREGKCSLQRSTPLPQVTALRPLTRCSSQQETSSASLHPAANLTLGAAAGLPRGEAAPAASLLLVHCRVAPARLWLLLALPQPPEGRSVCLRAVPRHSRVQ